MGYGLGRDPSSACIFAASVVSTSTLSLLTSPLELLGHLSPLLLVLLLGKLNIEATGTGIDAGLDATAESATRGFETDGSSTAFTFTVASTR